MHTLAGRVAVVTGAAGGLGLGLARTLGAAGMRLVLADIDAAALQEAAEDLRTEVEAVAAVPTDVRDEDQVDRLAKQAVATFGRVDLLVNNAGVWTLGYQWETPLADWRWVVDVNFWGVVHGVRAFVPLLLANPDGGHVINVASMGGIRAGAFSGPYAATKHAVVGLERRLR
jgi:NAD(P)-dependent dehydrogenase (short-subunit alcohol dehydrogenase family)